MKYVKKNKKTFIAIGIFLLFVILLIPIKTALFPNAGKAIYGDRLDGIEKVKITDSQLSKAKDTLKDDAVSKVTARVSGKTVEIIITVNQDVSLDTAKSYGTKVIEPFKDSQKKYYDFQIFITKAEASDEFPIIGYKHHSLEGITWTKDRTGSAEWKRSIY